MLNDRSSILSLLETRRSGKPRELVGPGPSREEMEQILAIAARDARTMASSPRGASSPSPTTSATRFAALLQRGARRGGPERAAAQHEKDEEFAHYAGPLVVLVSAPVEDHKIPVWEQQLSCGAAGMNLLLAAHALGFVAGWVTGWRAYSRARPRAPFADRANGSPDSSSSAMPAASSKNGRGPPLATVWRPWQPPDH